MATSNFRTNWSARALRNLVPAALAASLVLLGGCDTARVSVAPKATETKTGLGSTTCYACHGGPENAAPPRGLHGQTETTDPGVGAHQLHLGNGPAHLAIACETCHVVPTDKYQKGHLDDPQGRATVEFSGLALAGGATPTYDAKEHSCSNTYCHGSTLKVPGKDAKPTWNQVDGKQRACSSCHGAPPPAPHPKDTECAGCHAATAGPKMTILNLAKHVNGKVEVVLSPNANCAGCHGAPPVSAKHPAKAQFCGDCHAATVTGERTLLAGGAHMDGKVQVQLAAKPTSCDGCHGAPPLLAGIDKKPHPQQKQCNDCHAATVDAAGVLIVGGAHMNKSVDVQLAAKPTSCAGCHGAPPLVAGVDKKPHPQQTQCNDCHAATVDENKTIIAGGGHMDGKVQVQLAAKPTSCSGCHGDPPLVAGADKKPHPQQTQCNDCHAATVDAAKVLIVGGSHMDGKVQVQLAPAPTSCTGCHGAPPVQISSSGKDHPKSAVCSDCHAATVQGDKQIIVGGGHLDGKVEVQLAASPSSCTGCHAAPPAIISSTGKPHPQSTVCSDCHAATVGADNKIIAGGSHLDGKIEVQVATAPSSCTGCHAAPPATIAATGKPHPKSDKCALCHAASIDADGHVVVGGLHYDGKVEFSIGPGTCTMCHDAPPATVGPDKKPHPNKMSACTKCHSTTVDPAGAIVAGGTHYDGKVEVILPTSCDTCHGKPGSKGEPAPDINGLSDPSLPSVGAHAAHLQGKNVSAGGMACETCHTLPATVDAPGHMYGQNTVFFPKGLGTLFGSPASFEQKTQTCSGTYCHGATMEGGKSPKMVWTMTTLSCDGCHGLPPAVITGHPIVDSALGTKACAQCHKKTVKPDGTIDAQGGFHINGWVDP